MSRSLYEALLRGEPTAGPAGLLGAFAAAASRVREQRATGLAQAEFEEGQWVDDAAQPWLDADLDDLALAARDTADLDFPVRYRGAGLTVLLGLDEDGRTYGLLEVGPGPVRLAGQSLAVGVEVRVSFDEPPQVLILDDGTRLEP